MIMDSVEMKENMLDENNTSTTMENNVTNQVATEVTTEKETTQDNAKPKKNCWNNYVQL